MHIDKAMEIVRNNVCMRSDLGYWKTLHFDLSEILRELGELPKEAQVYRDLIGDLREDDEHIGVIRQSLVRCEHELALVERALGNREEARTHIDKAIEIVRSDVNMRSDLGYWKTLHVELSYIFRELGETSKEAQIYRDLIGDLGEDDEDIWVNRLSLARCETELSRFEAAREIFDVIQRSAPSRELREMAGKEMIRLRYRIALRHYEMGEYETSIKGSEAILALCEVDPELHASLLILLGNGYAMLKKYAQARRFWDQVTASPSARRDQRDQAEESLRRLPPRGVDVSERIH